MFRIVSRAGLILLAALLLTPSAIARPKPDTGAVAPTGGWAPHQATGAPNCPGAGDSQLAWATLTADAGEEWLELDYAKAVPIKSIIVHQNDYPGAVVRVEARDNDIVTVLWTGTSPKMTAPARQIIVATTKTTASTIRIVLDTRTVSGWNEIDAVELVGRDGSRQWAKAARASSTYAASGSGPAAGVWAYIGKAVKLRVGGQALRGEIKNISGNWATFQPVGQPDPILLNLQRVDWIRLE